QRSKQLGKQLCRRGKAALRLDTGVGNRKGYPQLQIGGGQSQARFFGLNEDVAQDGERCAAGNGVGYGLDGFEKIFASADGFQAGWGFGKRGGHSSSSC